MTSSYAKLTMTMPQVSLSQQFETIWEVLASSVRFIDILTLHKTQVPYRTKWKILNILLPAQ